MGRTGPSLRACLACVNPPWSTVNPVDVSGRVGALSRIALIGPVLCCRSRTANVASEAKVVRSQLRPRYSTAERTHCAAALGAVDLLCAVQACVGSDDVGILLQRVERSLIR